MTLINLRQARRLERELANAQQKLAAKLNEHSIKVSIHEDFSTAVGKVQDKQTDTSEAVMQLIKLRFEIRKAIETKNETSGINSLMNEEAALKEQLKVMESVICHQFTNEELQIAQARHAALVKNGPATDTYGRTHDSVELDGRVGEDFVNSISVVIKTAQRRIVKIVEELGHLNSTTTIQLSEEMIQQLEDEHDIIV